MVGTDGTTSKVAGQNGSPNAAQQVANSTATYGIRQAAASVGSPGGDWLVLEADVSLVAGSLIGAGLHVDIQNAAGVSQATVTRNLATEADASGRVRGAGVAGQTYRFRYIIDARHANAAQYSLTGYARLATFAPAAGATVKWHRLGARPATPEEISTATVVPDLAAQVSVISAAIANADGLDAYWEVTTVAGSATAGIRARANSTGGSLVAMVADAIALYNDVDGVAEMVMEAAGGNVFIRNLLTIGELGEIKLDPSVPAIIWTFGTAKVAIGKLPNDNLIFWFGVGQNVADMTKGNASSWMDKAGKAFFKSIAIGTSGEAYSDSTAVPASIDLAPISSNGDPITVEWTYSYESLRQRFAAAQPTVSGANTATVQLWRKLGAGAWVKVDEKAVAGTSAYSWEEIDAGPPIIGNTSLNVAQVGSWTYTDTDGGLDDREWRVTVSARETPGFAGGTFTESCTFGAYAVEE